MENRPMFHVLGCAAVLVSGINLEDWERVERFALEALKIMDERGETLFRAATNGKGGGSITRYGVNWNTVTEDGKATITVLLDPEVDDRYEALNNVAGSALLDLAGMEQAIREILKDIAGKEAEIAARIQVGLPAEGETKE